jgi:hypothetical protein
MLFSRDKSNDFSHVMATMHAICPLTIVNQLHRTLNLLSSETDLTPIKVKIQHLYESYLSAFIYLEQSNITN